MKFIKFFLASSIVEFETERYEIGDFIRVLNNILIKHNIYVELILCEDLSNSIVKERKQEEYNQQIRESQYIYIFCGKIMGEYTREEFSIAEKQFQEIGMPQIRVFFFDMSQEDLADQSVHDFLKYLEKNRYEYHKIKHLDIVKYQLLTEVLHLCNKENLLKTETDEIVLHNRAVLMKKNILEDLDNVG